MSSLKVKFRILTFVLDLLNLGLPSPEDIKFISMIWLRIPGPVFGIVLALVGLRIINFCLSRSDLVRRYLWSWSWSVLFLKKYLVPIQVWPGFTKWTWSWPGSVLIRGSLIRNKDLLLAHWNLRVSLQDHLKSKSFNPFYNQSNWCITKNPWVAFIQQKWSKRCLQGRRCPRYWRWCWWTIISHFFLKIFIILINLVQSCDRMWPLW